MGEQRKAHPPLWPPPRDDRARGRQPPVTTLLPVLARHAGSLAGWALAALALCAESATLCLDNRPAPQWQVLIAANGTSIQITTNNAHPQQLSLRQGLLPQVHHLADGRHALMATGDGWIFRLDLERAQLVAETRVGLRVNAAALSARRAGQAQLLAVASSEPPALTVLDEYLQLLRQLPTIDKTGRPASGVLAIRTAGGRDSFVALLNGAPELWEVSYNPHAPEIGLGLVHDFRYQEGQFVPGYLHPQRSTLASPAYDVFLMGPGHEALTIHGTPSERKQGTVARLYVTHLDVRRSGAEYAVRFLPDDGRSPWLLIDPGSAPGGLAIPLGVDPSTLRFSASRMASDGAGCAQHP